MSTSNPIRQAVRKFDGDYERLARSLTESIRTSVDKDGLSYRIAVVKAFADLDVYGVIEDSILDGVVALAAKSSEGAIDKDAYRRWYLNQHFAADGLTLSQRIVSAGYVADVATTINIAMRQADSWTEMARAISTQDLVAGDIKGSLSDLADMARRVYAGSPEEAARLRSAILSDARYIKRLAANGAPTEYLQRAYANVIKQVEKGAGGAIDAALERAINAKMRYNAERIARTEMARSYGKGFFTAADGDPDALGWRLVLSDRHGVDDECDDWANADLYGMGPGVFPIGQGPEYPIHPNCLCLLETVYSNEFAVADATNSPDASALPDGVTVSDVMQENTPIPEHVLA